MTTRGVHQNCGRTILSSALTGDAAYDSEKVRQTVEQAGILFLSPINRRNSEERKDAYGRVLPVLLKTRFGQ